MFCPGLVLSEAFEVATDLNYSVATDLLNQSGKPSCQMGAAQAKDREVSLAETIYTCTHMLQRLV